MIYDLYRIVFDGNVWTMTSSNVPQTYDSGSGAELYVPTVIKRGNYEQKNEMATADLEIGIPIDHELSIRLLSSYSEAILGFTLFSRNSAGAVSVAWKGRLSSIKPSDTYLTLKMESIFTSLRRPGLRARFQKNCRHAVYGRGCNLSQATFEYSGTVTALNGTVLTVTEAGTEETGFFIGGMLAAPDGALSYIINHSGSSITLQRTNYSLVTSWALLGSGMPVKLYPGCDLTRNTCNSRFGNLDNYGGFDWIPKKNPMGGNSIV